MNLSGKTAIITGASAGIGRGIAVALGARGMNAVCCARRRAALEETVGALEAAGGKGLAVACDVTDRRSVAELVEEATAAFGPVDLLYNNAGRFNTIGGLWEVDPDEWWADATVNLLGPVLTCQAVLPRMMERNSGIIINMNGGGATVPLPGGSAYGSSKAALLRLTETLALELKREGKDGVMVFALGPGLVRTEMTERQAESEMGRKWIPSTAESFAKDSAGTPEMVGEGVAAFLDTVARPELSGRIFSAREDFSQLSEARIAEIIENDKRLLRGT